MILEMNWTVYCAVQKNSVPAAVGAVATSHTFYLFNWVITCALRSLSFSCDISGIWGQKEIH